jgi:hypothetical protein
MTWIVVVMEWGGDEETPVAYFGPYETEAEARIIEAKYDAAVWDLNKKRRDDAHGGPYYQNATSAYAEELHEWDGKVVR